MPVKKTKVSAQECCNMCGKPGCGCYKWGSPLKGLILIVLGILFWSKALSLEQLFGILLVLGGLKIWIMHSRK
jgi:hypothetical protein